VTLPGRPGVRHFTQRDSLDARRFVQHYQLTFSAVCGILMVSRGEAAETGSCPNEWGCDPHHLYKNFQRNSKKPLDKSPEL
jgi:hypothetical protein